jgi:hypothetical protein
MEYFGFYSEEKDGPLPPLPSKSEGPDPMFTALAQIGLDFISATFITRLAVNLVWNI